MSKFIKMITYNNYYIHNYTKIKLKNMKNKWINLEIFKIFLKSINFVLKICFVKNKLLKLL